MFLFACRRDLREVLDEEIRMKTVRLGRTNLEVPVLGIGGIPIQRPSDEEVIEVIQAAMDIGIRLVDTARGYGTSEERFGKALEGQRPEGLVLATKSPKRDADGVRQDIETSLKNLRVDCIDIYQCHGPREKEQLDQILGPGGALEAMRKAQSEGLIRFVGITSHRYDILEAGIRCGEFDTVMVQYSFMDKDARDRVFPLARERDVGILLMKAMGGGVFERASAALRWVLQEPDLAIPVGMQKVSEVKENWEIVSGDWTLTDDDWAYIRQIEQDLTETFCRRCGYCQPCPNNVSIPPIMSFQMLYQRLGWRDSYPRMLESARKCVGCKECEEKCPYDLSISTQIPKIAEEIARVIAEHSSGESANP